MTKLTAASLNFANAPVNGLKMRNGNHNINKTATLVLESGYPSATCQEMTATHAMRHGVTTKQATLDSLKASCAGDLRSTVCVRQYKHRQVGATDGLCNSRARRSVEDASNIAIGPDFKNQN
jgi:hypothetical protein